MLSPQRWQEPYQLKLLVWNKSLPLIIRVSKEIQKAEGSTEREVLFSKLDLSGLLLSGLDWWCTKVFRLLEQQWLSYACIHKPISHTHTHSPHNKRLAWKETQFPIFQWLKIKNLDWSCCPNSFLFKVKCEWKQWKSHTKSSNQKIILMFLLHFLKIKIFKKI